MVLIDCTLQIEDVVAIDDFEKGFVVRQVSVVFYLFLEGDFCVIRDKLELISAAHQHHRFVGLERFLG